MRSHPTRQSSALGPCAAAVLFFSALPATAATFEWTAGNYSIGTFTGPMGPNPLAAGDTLNISTASVKGFIADFTNDGTVQHQIGGGGVSMGNGSILTNNGLWEDLGANGIGVSTGGSVINNGVYRKSGTGISSLAPTSMINNGTIDVQQGTLTLGNNITHNGVLMGNGLINSFFGVNSAGTLAPGSFGAGTLTLNGNYTQAAAGTFAVDLTNLGSKDLFSVLGATNLAGTLALNCLGACSFAPGDSFTILSSGSPRAGTFSSVTLNGFGTGSFDVVYASNSVSLTVLDAVTPVPELSTWAMLLLGLAALSVARKKHQG